MIDKVIEGNCEKIEIFLRIKKNHTDKITLNP